MKDYQHGILHTMPVEGQIDYRRTLELYKELVEGFPDYRNRDMALYLWGYLLYLNDEFVESIRVFKKLLSEHKESKFVVDSWYLVGHNNYVLERWNEAVAAYGNVVSAISSGETYYFSLYRLGWSLAEVFDHRPAIDVFMRLLLYIRDNEAEVRQSGDLKKEAIESIAASFVDDDWDGNSEKDPDFGPARALALIPEGQPFAKELLKYYGDLLTEFKRVKYTEDAVMVLREYLRRYPLDEHNPEVHDQLILAMYELGSSPELPASVRSSYLEQSLAERSRIMESYGPGSAWAVRHEYNTKALDRANKALAVNLRDRAVILDNAADNATTPEEATQLYQRAATAMEDFLRAVPNSPDFVDFAMRLADIRFFRLGQMHRAAVLYGEIRDRQGTVDIRKRLEASAKALEARAALVAGAAESGNQGQVPQNLFELGVPVSLAKVEPAKGNDPTAINRVTAVEVPQVVKDWMAEAEKFLKVESNTEEHYRARAETLFLIGKVHYRYGNFEKAREIYRKVMDDYGKYDAIIGYCFVDIARTYRVENDLDNLEKVSMEMQESGKGDPNDLAATLESIKTARFDARFQRSNELLKQAEEAMAADDVDKARELYARAAREQERVVDENPTYHQADAALLLAADAYEKVQLYDRAAGLYRRLVDEPRFVKSKYREMAVRQLAANYERFFNFDAAVTTYRRLVDEFPQGTNVRLGLLTVFELMENDQRYGDAARVMEEYVRRFGQDKDRTGENMYKVAELYELAKERGRAEAAYEAFIKKYRKDTRFTIRVMTAMMVLARWYDEAGKTRQAREYYMQVRSMYVETNQEPRSPGAYLAAEAEFRLAEARVGEYHSLKVERGRFKAQIDAAMKKGEKINELTDAFLKVEQYLAAEWSVAAFYRVGMLWKDLAEVVETIPFPTDLPDTPENLEQYRIEMRGLRARFQDDALSAWRFGMEISRGAGVLGEWATRTLRELNQFAAERAKYPLYRDLRQAPAGEPLLHHSVLP